MRDIILLKDGWRFGITAAVEGESMPVLPETMETVSIPHVWNKDDPAKTGYCVYQYSFRGEDISGWRNLQSVAQRTVHRHTSRWL